MSPAFLIFAVALAAILIWALANKAIFERRVNDRIEREKALGKRAADYRANLTAKIDELQKRISEKDPKRTGLVDLVGLSEEVGYALAEVATSGGGRYVVLRDRSFAPRFYGGSPEFVPIIDPKKVTGEMIFRHLHGGVIEKREFTSEPEVVSPKGRVRSTSVRAAAASKRTGTK